MKYLVFFMMILVCSCNNSDLSIYDKSDSLDAIADTQKHLIDSVAKKVTHQVDSVAQVAKSRIDSTTDQKKQALDSP